MTTPISFEDAVTKVALKDGVTGMLMVPGVWEAVSEHYNNDALRLMEEHNEEVNEEDNSWDDERTTHFCPDDDDAPCVNDCPYKEEEDKSEDTSIIPLLDEWLGWEI